MCISKKLLSCGPCSSEILAPETTSLHSTVKAPAGDNFCLELLLSLHAIFQLRNGSSSPQAVPYYKRQAFGPPCYFLACKSSFLHDQCLWSLYPCVLKLWSNSINHDLNSYFVYLFSHRKECLESLLSKSIGTHNAHITFQFVLRFFLYLHLAG